MPHPAADPGHPVADSLALSVVAPAHNEQDNVQPLVEEVAPAARQAATVFGGGFEFIIVDDGSTDATAERVRSLMGDRPWLRLVRMLDTPPGRGNGQSAAFHAGFRAARGRFIAVLDADLQNDPADLPAMAEQLVARHADFVQGDRSHDRKDNFAKRRASEVGRLFRRVILGDRVRDTGCSLRVMRREIALRLPLEFKGMHRFIPVSAARMGYTVIEMPVRHRARHAGETKYGKLGISKRAIPGLIDCFAVLWMSGRRRPVNAEEVRTASLTARAESTSAPAGAASR